MNVFWDENLSFRTYWDTRWGSQGSWGLVVVPWFWVKKLHRRFLETSNKVLGVMQVFLDKNGSASPRKISRARVSYVNATSCTRKHEDYVIRVGNYCQTCNEFLVSKRRSNQSSSSILSSILKAALCIRDDLL